MYSALQRSNRKIKVKGESSTALPSVTQESISNADADGKDANIGPSITTVLPRDLLGGGEEEAALVYKYTNFGNDCVL